MTIASPRKGWPSLKMGTSILATQSCVTAPLMRSVITIERVAERATLRLDRQRIAAWQGLPRLGESVHELLAICISDQYPGISPGRERAARLSLKRIEIVVEQRRRARQRFRQRHVLAELGIDAGRD